MPILFSIRSVLRVCIYIHNVCVSIYVDIVFCVAGYLSLAIYLFGDWDSMTVPILQRWLGFLFGLCCWPLAQGGWGTRMMQCSGASCKGKTQRCMNGALSGI